MYIFFVGSLKIVSDGGEETRYCRISLRPFAIVVRYCIVRRIIKIHIEVENVLDAASRRQTETRDLL